MFSIIRGGCHSRHDRNFILSRPNGLPYYVLLIIKTHSELSINGKQQICKPNSALIIKPNTPYSYKNPNGEYIDDWIHFNCESNDIECLENILNKSFAINNASLITTYLQQILWENNFCNTTSKKEIIDSLFRIIIKHICDDYNNEHAEDYNPYKYKFQQLRLDIAAAPYNKYTAKEMAKAFKLSTSHFQMLYKKIFGISFQADIINMRMDYSKELITSTTLPLEQIAYSCGYSSEVHFYRQFLSHNGITPGEFRKMYSK